MSKQHKWPEYETRSNFRKGKKPFNIAAFLLVVRLKYLDFCQSTFPLLLMRGGRKNKEWESDLTGDVMFIWYKGRNWVFSSFTTAI